MGHFLSKSKKNKPFSWPPEGNTLPMATFAGGCFWGLQLAYQRVPGVVETCVGYSGGTADNPSYNEVCSGSTGHAEAVQMTYDPEKVTYDRLCELFFSRIDAYAKNRQGNDVGTQYRTGIYTHTKEQAKIAESHWPSGCAVEIKEFDKFWPAEVEHQRYLERGGRFGRKQNAAKMCNDPIRCYG
ncbi:unnamed protein product [Ostreobium quekettii]|uniref:peptide-methionine (S)-S-oxide reductase n=1 Tax=Ostreobium quekettii TaxID=121088 RepID=A0A8S1J5S0_9CHLO|nr:unnamed protein product [Ostreobium quekettii]|eukprot:evm.model.scf_119EXC.20 EVM.evm.TU.scf_119EXC.20   scf_119EXC:123489-125154(-)